MYVCTVSMTILFNTFRYGSKYNWANMNELISVHCGIEFSMKDTFILHCSSDALIRCLDRKLTRFWVWFFIFRCEQNLDWDVNSIRTVRLYLSGCYFEFCIWVIRLWEAQIFCISHVSNTTAKTKNFFISSSILYLETQEVVSRELWTQNKPCCFLSDAGYQALVNERLVPALRLKGEAKQWFAKRPGHLVLCFLNWWR